MNQIQLVIDNEDHPVHQAMAELHRVAQAHDYPMLAIVAGTTDEPDHTGYHGISGGEQVPDRLWAAAEVAQISDPDVFAHIVRFLEALQGDHNNVH